MKPPNTAGLVGALACAALLFIQWDAAGQTAQLNRIGNRLAGDGFTITHERNTGSLYEDEEATFSVWLVAGTEYAIRGTCDDDCTDLDLELKRNARAVDRDFTRDDVPEVSVRPGTSGWYQVRVVMASCTVAPCRYAVGIFGRR